MKPLSEKEKKTGHRNMTQKRPNNLDGLDVEQEGTPVTSQKYCKNGLHQTANARRKTKGNFKKGCESQSQKHWKYLR